MSSMLSNNIISKLDTFISQFTDRAILVCNELEDLARQYPIVIVLVYGSVLTGPYPGSDIDILVLFDKQGFHYQDEYLEMRDAISDICFKYEATPIPVDIQVFDFDSFLESDDTDSYKRGISAHNQIMWMEAQFFEQRGFI